MANSNQVSSGHKSNTNFFTLTDLFSALIRRKFLFLCVFVVFLVLSFVIIILSPRRAIYFAVYTPTKVLGLDSKTYPMASFLQTKMNAFVPRDSKSGVLRIEKTAINYNVNNNNLILEITDRQDNKAKVSKLVNEVVFSYFNQYEKEKIADIIRESKFGIMQLEHQSKEIKDIEDGYLSRPEKEEVIMLKGSDSLYMRDLAIQDKLIVKLNESLAKISDLKNVISQKPIASSLVIKSFVSRFHLFLKLIVGFLLSFSLAFFVVICLDRFFADPTLSRSNTK